MRNCTIVSVRADETDEDGQAEFCYTGTTVGADEITAYADSDDDTTQDAGEPVDVATKTWLPAEPAFLTLTPKTAQNIVNTEHCVQAHVTDAFLNPNPDETVYFVVTGTVERQGSEVTDEGGIAEFCYTSTTPGADEIPAYADSLDPPVGESSQQDPGEPFDDATKLWHPGDPATLDLKPETSTNEVGTEHCVKAEVRDAFGNPTPDEEIRFDVEGASEEDEDPDDEDGSDTTDEFGNAEFCYTGPDLPGADTIHAYADNDGDETQDGDETARDTATKTWILPPSTPGCEIKMTHGGWIRTLTGSKGTFGGNARIEEDGEITRGELTYQDHSTLAPITFHSLEVEVIVCAADSQGRRADVYGTGRVNGVGPVDFRVRVRDGGEPGSQPAGPDTYQIITAAYASGPEDNPLQGGNVQIHRFDQPTVSESSLTPKRNQKGVSRTTNVSATFSEAMQPGSLSTSTFQLQQYNSKTGTWKAIPATLSLSKGNTKATLDPFGTTETGTRENPLAANKKFRGLITTGAEDLAGNPLGSKFIWTFTTGDR